MVSKIFVCRLREMSGGHRLYVTSQAVDLASLMDWGTTSEIAVLAFQRELRFQGNNNLESS